ncbi:MAG: heat-inducible transcription repressor HrcA [Acidimicrobiia bacterium]|nr:heat-inducible transcriptional repressor HrcA [Acidimicrobiia bacterium]MBT8217938.1 heat-inducible transcriptional repressor HrcA [Acidimicrobiia bacterium]NNF09048.1 heat-inducible transcription repressor HrcA [Acidimicrobiia bacterium]NNL71068.1 heat-inducible transcription repressor HrcA [Acidimicrobiia bacterium]
MDDRKAAVLNALVDEHIRTGNPVSSRAILEASKLNVSSATIRNDLAALEAEGYVRQPHTSAGRVPTERGFRYYVDTTDPARLRAGTRERISEFFQSFHHELRSLLKQTSELLTDITAYPAVVIGPGLVGEEIHGVHLVQLGSHVLLMVLVTEAGQVTQELVRLPSAIQPAQVSRLEEALERALVGNTLAEARRNLKEAPRELPAGDARIVSTLADAALKSEADTRELFVGGTSMLAGLWEDISKVHFILELLERDSSVMGLVDNQQEGTSVLIGPELGENELDLAVVSTSYGVDVRSSGRVAVLGPMRMNYRRTIRVVEEVGEGLTDSLSS